MHPSLRTLGVAVAATLAASTADAADWMQFGYDAAHTGFNPDEAAISAANVASLTTLYHVDLPASVDSAPVYLSNVETPGGTKNLLFALSQNGRLMAIDAASGSEVWHAETSGNQPTTASPAIDPNRQFVYSYGIDGNAHKYQVGDGTEITGSGWPQTITLKPNVEKGASGLTIAQASGGATYLVVVTDGYVGDGGDYQGHLVSIDLSNGAQNVFNVMCSDLAIHFVDNGTPGTDDCNYGDDPPNFRRGQMSGIWGRGGATYDAATNRVFIATGNGDFNANGAGLDWGDSVLALAPDGTGAGGGMPLDSYTPTNYVDLYNADTDLGSISTVVMQPPAGSAVAHLGMQTGKDAKLRLLDLDDMSGAGAPANVGGELQLINVPQGGGGMREQPATFVDAGGTAWLFVANRNGLSGLRLGLDGSNVPALTPVWQNGDSTTSPAIANGVLYSISDCAAGSCIVARDPATGDPLWTSDAIGGPHWQSPIVVDGKVFVMDGDGVLWAFGLGAQGDPIFADGFDS
jgi:outer membrane protein assembly factor BamB